MRPAPRQGATLWARCLGPIAATAVALAPSGPSQASSFSLEGFITEDDGSFVLDEPLLAPLLMDILASLQPHSRGTGAALGPGGFALGLGLGLTPVDAASAHWQAADTDERSELTPFQLAARVGLSDGLELGVHAAHLSPLELSSASLELRWSLFSGRRGLPNLAFSLDAGALVGHPSMTMAHAGTGILLGFDIPIAGVLRLSPFAGYSFRFGHTLGRQIAVFADAEAEPLRTVLPGQPLVLHEVQLGFLIALSPLELLVEVDAGTRTSVRLSVAAHL